MPELSPANDAALRELANFVAAWNQRWGHTPIEELVRLHAFADGRMGVHCAMERLKALPPLYPDDPDGND